MQSPVVDLSVVLRNHAFTAELIHGYMVRHLAARVSENPGIFFSLPMRRSALVVLVSALLARQSKRTVAFDPEALHLVPEQESSLDNTGLDDDAPLKALIEEDWFDGALKQFFFFKVVRTRLQLCVRQHVESERGLGAHDLIIAAHRVVAADATARHVIVNALSTEPGLSHSERTFVLSLSAAPLEMLLKIRSWSVRDKLSYRLDSQVTHESHLPEGSAQALPGLLCDLLATEGGDAVIDQDHPESKSRQALLAHMHGLSLVERAERSAGRLEKRFLTGLGKRSVICGQELHDPMLTFSIQSDKALNDKTVWELVMHLEAEGWRHTVCPDAHATESYKPGLDKVWYTRPWATSISKIYLLALAQASGEVPHLAKSHVYAALLTDEPPAVKGKALTFMTVAEDDLDAADNVALQSAQQRQRRRATKRAANSANKRAPQVPEAPAEADHGTESSASSSPRVLEAPAEADRGAESSASSSRGCASGSSEQPSSPKGNSSGPSSSSSSSSSTSAGDGEASDMIHATPPGQGSVAEPGPSSGEAGAAPAGDCRSGEPALEAEAGARRRNTQKHDLDWGLNHGVRVMSRGTHTGWEASCHRPDHQRPILCRKSLRLTAKGRAAADTLRMLQVWLVWGAADADRDTRQKSTWTRVEAAFKNGILPDSEHPRLIFSIFHALLRTNIRD